MKLKSFVARARGLLAVWAAVCLSTLSACGGSSDSVAFSSASGQTVLVNSTPEAAGANCAAGGFRLQVGLDANANLALDAAEVQSDNYACNGQVGVTGPSGPVGPNGVSSLIRSTPESAGANCAAGGWLIEAGQDTNRNNTLDTAEIQSSSYACNGTSGTNGTNGLNSLMLTTAEPAGSNCSLGGLKVETGLDASRDGVLQPTEVSQTSYLCLPSSQVAKSWKTPSTLDALNATASRPQIAIDANGNGLAVWEQNDGQAPSIFANRYSTFAGWGAPVAIETITGNASYPQIAMDANGNGMAVWVHDDGSSASIMANKYTAGTAMGSGWGTAVVIGAGARFAFAPQVAIDSNGNTLVVWSQGNSAIDTIMSNRYTAGSGVGSGWGTAAAIEAGVGGTSNPQIAMDANGNAIAVWSESANSASSNIVANRYTAGTGVGSGWGTAAAITVGNYDFEPQIAVAANGNALVVWTQLSVSGDNIMATQYIAGAGAGSGWGTATSIETGAGSAGAPQIAIDANGNGLAVWSQQDGSAKIFANRYTAGSGVGSGWGTDAAISSGAGAAVAPQIAISASGNAVAVWVQDEGSVTSILGSQYTADTGWGLAVAVELGSGAAANPKIAINPSGNAISVWIQNDGTSDNIMANGLN